MLRKKLDKVEYRNREVINDRTVSLDFIYFVTFGLRYLVLLTGSRRVREGSRSLVHLRIFIVTTQLFTDVFIPYLDIIYTTLKPLITLRT